MKFISSGILAIGRFASMVRLVAPDFRDAHVYGGGLLIAAGAWMWFPPAAPIAFGAILLFLGLRK